MGRRRTSDVKEKGIRGRGVISVRGNQHDRVRNQTEEVSGTRLNVNKVNDKVSK